MREITFEVGDTIRIIDSCSGTRRGEYYTLSIRQGELWAGNYGGAGCHCRDNWKLIKKKIDFKAFPMKKRIKYLTQYIVN
jgi:hypothetical protein